jgi:hypothetical protein
VDVCTYRGLRDGVPGVLEVLRRARARATFFVTFGPDASGLALLKLLKPSFALRMIRNRAGSTYGWASAFYGTLLPSPLVGSGLPDVVRRIRDEGHEVGLHGWDHRRWQDRLPRYPDERLRREFGLMLEACETVLGSRAEGFAAPAWLATPALLALEEEAGFRYAADTLGGSPFLPVMGGRTYRVPQLPVTLPILDECLGRWTAAEFVERVAREATGQPKYACFAAHAETEGRAHRPVLEDLLARLNRPCAPLGETPLDNLADRPLVMGRVEGRPYDVCVRG